MLTGKERHHGILGLLRLRVAPSLYATLEDSVELDKLRFNPINRQGIWW